MKNAVSILVLVLLLGSVLVGNQLLQQNQNPQTKASEGNKNKWYKCTWSDYVKPRNDGVGKCDDPLLAYRYKFNFPINREGLFSYRGSRYFAFSCQSSPFSSEEKLFSTKLECVVDPNPDLTTVDKNGECRKYCEIASDLEDQKGKFGCGADEYANRYGKCDKDHKQCEGLVRSCFYMNPILPNYFSKDSK